MPDGLLDVIFVVSWILLGMTFLRIIVFVGMSSRHHKRHQKYHPTQLSATPLVSVLVPSHNEGITLYNCINSLVVQTYPNLEIIIINDGSTDDTLAVAKRIARKHRTLIRVADKKWGGKAAALNRGIERANGEIIVCIDADSMFMPNTVEQLVLSFQDPSVSAVGGNVKVANRSAWLSRLQALEYVTGLTLIGRTFAHLGCMQVISGAIGAFRKEALLSVGGYPQDTIVEDMDLTIELARRGHKIVFNPFAVAYTEAPETLGDFLKQRYRWRYGSFQVLSKHRDLLWKRSSKTLGLIGMPYFLIFPWVDVLVTLLVIFTLTRVFISGQEMELLLIYAFMCTVQASMIFYAIMTDKEDKKLAGMAIIDLLVYYHLLNFTTLHAGVNFMRKKTATWNKLQRYGRNVVPQQLATQEVETKTTVSV